MTLQPRLHLGMCVRAVVVHAPVQRHRAGKLVIQRAQELQELLMPMTFVALTDDFALQRSPSAANRQVVPLRL